MSVTFICVAVAVCTFSLQERNPVQRAPQFILSIVDGVVIFSVDGQV